MFTKKPSSYPPFRPMHYREYVDNPMCRHVMLSDRAYAAIIAEVLRNGSNETGGIFIGNIWQRVWFIADCIDPGLSTVNEQSFFTWDSNYVNHLLDRVGSLYKYPLTLLGFWHRHPGSLDTFSATDMQTIRTNLRDCPHGLLSMLVNIDPELRMTFYYCYDNTIMPIRYDHGDEYFPKELLEYATPEELIQRRHQHGLRVTPVRCINPATMPKSIHQNDKLQPKPAPHLPSSPSSPLPLKDLRTAETRPRVTAVDGENPKVNLELAEYLASKIEAELKEVSLVYGSRLCNRHTELTNILLSLISPPATPHMRKGLEPSNGEYLSEETIAALEAEETPTELEEESEGLASPQKRPKKKDTKELTSQMNSRRNSSL